MIYDFELTFLLLNLSFIETVIFIILSVLLNYLNYWLIKMLNPIKIRAHHYNKNS